MNDTELDHLLNTWTVPAPPPSLRASVRAGYATLAPKARRRFRLSFRAIAFLFTAFLVVVTVAFPKTVKLLVSPAKIPYIVETDSRTYNLDGSLHHETHISSYLRNGMEIILSQAPGNPLATFAIRNLNAALSPFLSRVDPKRWAEFVASGCSNEGTVVGHEIILGYRTTVTEHRSPSRDAGDVLQDGRIITLWQAPDLGCFDLKMVHEQENSDGTYRLVEERHALKVTVNP
ncbi:MAG TPA: hypothetical protein VME43_26485 [Bryobacteraceae bacterium]|nr:hypothetical protein [Bryobacteraceae bacterium]